MKRIARLASGFIYAVARTGVTGAARELADESEDLVARIRGVSDLPVAVGFGITSGAQARRVCRYADAAVVGSHLVAVIEDAAEKRPFGRARVVRSAIRAAQAFFAAVCDLEGRPSCRPRLVGVVLGRINSDGTAPVPPGSATPLSARALGGHRPPLQI